MCIRCFIIPNDALEKLAETLKLSEEERKSANQSLKISKDLRKLRNQTLALTATARSFGAVATELASVPTVTVYNCQNSTTLPGSPVPNPGGSSDGTASRTFRQTADVAKFYKEVFGRNSIDGLGMTMMSSIHYGMNYNNAMWNGAQMIYGDGDNQIFTDFTLGNDVIAHELTHGVTQYTLALKYTGDAGGLNESLSDVFGSMFRQWQANQDVSKADWLIGHDILGKAAKAKYTCLRNMANPADPKAIAPQPSKYSQLKPGMDPHYTSGPPNLAFSLAAKEVGGKSWEKVGQVWYKVMTTSGSKPTMKMRVFANATRKVAADLYPGTPAVAAAVDKAWKQVEL